MERESSLAVDSSKNVLSPRKESFMMWKRVFFGAIIGTGCAVGGASESFSQDGPRHNSEGQPGWHAEHRSHGRRPEGGMHERKDSEQRRHPQGERYREHSDYAARPHRQKEPMHHTDDRQQHRGDRDDRGGPHSFSGPHQQFPDQVRHHLEQMAKQIEMHFAQVEKRMNALESVRHHDAQQSRFPGSMHPMYGQMPQQGPPMGPGMHPYPAYKSGSPKEKIVPHEASEQMRKEFQKKMEEGKQKMEKAREQFSQMQQRIIELEKEVKRLKKSVKDDDDD